MRIVSGKWRGRNFAAPPGDIVRPTGDRVREAWMSIVNPLLAGARVVDLFAGSGALGIEALSRGAARCTFVDSSRAAVDVVRANLDATALTPHADVVTADAFVHVRRHPSAVDLALLDPPYAFTDWDGLLEVVPAPLVVIESNRPVEPTEGWDVLRSHQYGTTVVTFARRRSGPEPAK